MKYLCLNIKKPIKFLVAGKCVFDEDWMHYERILDEYALFIPISGALYLNVGNIDESLLPGDIYLINARTRHFGWKSSPVTFYCFILIWMMLKFLKRMTSNLYWKAKKTKE